MDGQPVRNPRLLLAAMPEGALRPRVSRVVVEELLVMVPGALLVESLLKYQWPTGHCCVVLTVQKASKCADILCPDC